MMTTNILLCLLLRSPTVRVVQNRSSSSINTRNLSHNWRRHGTRTTPRSSALPFFRTSSASAKSSPPDHYHNKLLERSSTLPVAKQYHQFRRRAFSRTLTELSVSEQSDEVSRSSIELSPLARSIEHSLEELLREVVGQKEVQTSVNTLTAPDKELETQRQRFLLVLSVSGGCDSVALLHATMELLQKTVINNWELDCRVVHFHHRQREKEADLDCQMVQDLALKEYGIPFVLIDWNDEQIGDSKFSQDRARQWRRQRLLEYTRSSLADLDCSNPPIGVILTAHHKDDSEESLLLKLLRGVHILNLSGMKAITAIEDNIYILRPWLQQRKADLQDYLLSNNKTWREDASNSFPKYLRNRVRNELIPLLEDLSPSIHKRLELLEEQSYELQQDLEPRILAHLEQQTEVDDFVMGERRQYIWEPQDLDEGATSPLVQAQALFRWMQGEISRNHELSNDESSTGHTSTAVSYETLQRVWKQLTNYPNQLDWSMDLGGNYSLLRKGSRLKIVHPADHSSIEQDDTGEKRTREWKWSVVASNERSHNDDATFLTLALPSELITGHLQFLETTVSELRSKEATLRFSPPWRKSSSIKLTQFLRGQKVSLHQRDATRILYMTSNHPNDEDGKIVAVQVNGTWIIHADYSHDTNESDSSQLWIQVKRS